MSLSVCLYRREDDGSTTELELDPSPGGDPALGGPESWRKTLWGGPLTRRIGCTVLPSLDGSEIRVSGETIVALIEDVRLIQAHVDEAAAVVGRPADNISFYFENIRRAAEKAIAMNDPRVEVVIW